MAAKAKKNRRNFSSFNLQEVLQELQVSELLRWEISAQAFHTSAYLAERLRRLENFDLRFSGRANSLLVDAFCDEVSVRHPALKIWKGVALQSDEVSGQADYLIAAKLAYLTTPLLCITEARKDNFEQGQAECLVTMKACRWNHEQAGRRFDLFGIVTNGECWQFYQFTTAGRVYQTLPYSLRDREQLLGALDYLLTKCEENLPAQVAAAHAA